MDDLSTAKEKGLGGFDENVASMLEFIDDIR
jgi:hypothetical protein